MQTAIKFVRGAIAKKDLVPILTSFHIYKGRIQGFNGSVCIDHPLERTDLDFTIPAKPFIRAVDICDGAPEITMLENGRARLSKDNFYVNIPLDDPELFPVVKHPVVYDHDLSPGFLDKLKLVEPFISDDASRPWSMSVKVSQGYLYATNNIVAVRVKINEPNITSDFTLSSELVTELLRIWQAPKHITCTEKESFFEYQNGAWIRGLTPTGEWPDLSGIFEFDTSSMEAVPGDLMQMVEKIKSFSEDGLIKFSDDGVYAGSEDEACIEGMSLHNIIFHVTPLLAVLKVAKKYDLAMVPPSFIGDGIEGRICHVSI